MLSIPCRKTREGNTGNATSEEIARRPACNEFRARHLGDVEFEIAAHAIEDFPCAGRAVHGNEIELDTIRPHIAAVEIEHAIIKTARHGQAQ